MLYLIPAFSSPFLSSGVAILVGLSVDNEIRDQGRKFILTWNLTMRFISAFTHENINSNFELDLKEIDYMVL